MARFGGGVMNLFEKQFGQRICSFVAIALISACGGGGGGGNGVNLAPLEYSGNTSAAVITTANAARLVTNVVGGDTSANVAVAAGVEIRSFNSSRISNAGIADTVRKLKKVIQNSLEDRSAVVLPPNSIASGVSINETRPCDSGTVRTTGTLNDDGTGTATIQYNNCRTGVETISGEAKIRVDAYDSALSRSTDYTVTYGRLTARAPGVSFDHGGSIRFQVDITGKSETATLNVVHLNNVTGKLLKTENYVSVEVYDNIFAPSTVTETIHGRIFDHVHGLIDVTTVAPLYSSNVIQQFPESGQISIVGDANRQIRAVAISSTMVKLEFDFDGDNIHERDAFLRWTELSSSVGADLADDDLDKIHNGWELANGLNPLDPTDTGLDSDDDGASNLLEYRTGYDPQNAFTTPPFVALRLTLDGPPSTTVVGEIIYYVIRVTNFGTDDAQNVVSKSVLPTGLELVSVTPTQGVCRGTSLIECDFGGLSKGSNNNFIASVSIGVVPVITGTKTLSASVITSSYESDPTDNDIVSQTIAGISTENIQNQIDNASSGDTVLVGPGLYVGNLTFFGKNIALRSVSGPESTILVGHQREAVHIGPGGNISGFKFVGSYRNNEPGVLQVLGEGTIIAGNIFEGIVLAGVSSVIYGNFASPIVEGNVFRGTSCADQENSGVLQFLNSASPVIVNNVFEKNTCIAVNLSSDATASPNVTGNTVVLNKAGIVVRNSAQGAQKFRSNIVFGNTIGLEVARGVTIGPDIWTCNLVFGNAQDFRGIESQTGISGNVAADPMFVDKETGNYRLKHGSPAIDSGSSIGAPGNDLDGIVRPIDGNGDGVAAFDIGAFEAPQFQ
jgi:uncharacterized repeat protein (TIGR01451 family)